MFKTGYLLTFSVKDNDDYMTVQHRGTNRLNELSFNTLMNLKISICPKAKLNINLNRNQSDNFTEFQISYNFAGSEDFFPLTLLSPQHIYKPALIVSTAAALFTKIKLKKRKANGVTSTRVDSIKCV